MKTPTLICCALALLIAGSADAKEKTAKTKRVKHVQQAAPPKDPYAAYWKDPGRAAPPFSYFGAGNW